MREERAMSSTNTSPKQVIQLSYRKGDLIIKKGDYGISIYKIIEGKVVIFLESGDKEVSLSTLGPGDIIGEVIFLNKGKGTRSASARALEDSMLEVWHPATLEEEYDQMPPMFKYITDQILSRLLRMNQFIVQLQAREEKKQKAIEKSDPFTSQRRYYRKDVKLDCQYRPVGLSQKVQLPGSITDISLSGIGMEIDTKNTTSHSHMQGDSFVVNIVLPNNQNLELKAKIVDVTKGESYGVLLLGMSITEISSGARKALGFFLMP